MTKQIWRWLLGLVYIFAAATIWIAASFVVQSVVDGGVSPFFVTYICNSLFLVYIPLVEIGRFLEDKYGSILYWWKKKETRLQELGDSEEVILLENKEAGFQADKLTLDVVSEEDTVNKHGEEIILGQHAIVEDANVGLDAKGRWTRIRVAKVSLLICPFWFLAQLTFNLSLKYTTVTSNTILSSASSLFTFLVALVFLGEKFTWVKLFSVLLCMVGTIIVSMGDSEAGSSSVAPNATVGDILSLLSAALYAVYITLIRKKLPDEEDGKNGQASMAQFLGYLGLFNLLMFLPVALLLNFAKLEPFNILSWKQIGLIVGKGSGRVSILREKGRGEGFLIIFLVIDGVREQSRKLLKADSDSHLTPACNRTRLIWWFCEFPFPFNFLRAEKFAKLELNFSFKLLRVHFFSWTCGLLDNVLSDYLWAKAVLLTSTTVATAGLTIQVPLAAVVDSITGNKPHLLDYMGAAAVMVGFAGINIPHYSCTGSEQGSVELEKGNLSSTGQDDQSLR